MAAVPAKTPQVAAAAMSVDWGRRRGEMKRKRPELDAGRAIAAANLVASTRPRARVGEVKKGKKIQQHTVTS
ncbi:hypothetical protein OsJ_25596 [Oryza sativa Japonica Group]|uniref:Uncharacterized protein n=1 Tax=Oryza sativa subsp. japonica TaxID=39947 RepID=B9FUW9_ORYSJ|nr:hypothetical protein OsJ_25596 [Oryza sativa Japonica Group]